MALRSALAPLALVNGPVHELADARAMALIILPVAFVDVTAGQDHLSLSVLEALGDAAVIDLARHLAELRVGIVEELVPVQGDSL